MKPLTLGGAAVAAAAIALALFFAPVPRADAITIIQQATPHAGTTLAFPTSPAVGDTVVAVGIQDSVSPLDTCFIADSASVTLANIASVENTGATNTMDVSAYYVGNWAPTGTYTISGSSCIGTKVILYELAGAGPPGTVTSAQNTTATITTGTYPALAAGGISFVVGTSTTVNLTGATVNGNAMTSDLNQVYHLIAATAYGSPFSATATFVGTSTENAAMLVTIPPATGGGGPVYGLSTQAHLDPRIFDMELAHSR